MFSCFIFPASWLPVFQVRPLHPSGPSPASSPSFQLKLTYDVAGVTFLALGNGAPDVFSSIAAFSSSDPSVVLVGVCEILGAAVFVTSIVVGAVALLHPATVRPQAFARDIFFQVLANILLTASALYGRVTWGLGLVYIALYATYVLVVLYLDRARKRAMAASSLFLNVNGDEGRECGASLEGGAGASGVTSAFWFTPSDISEFHRATETASVHKLTHDFLLLEEDEVSSESESEGEEEGGEAPRMEEGQEERSERKRRRNQNLEAGRHPFTHSLISEYFIDEGGSEARACLDGKDLLASSPPSAPTSEEGRSRQPLSSRTTPSPSSRHSPHSRSSGKTADVSSSTKRSFAPFSTALGKEEAYRVSAPSLNENSLPLASTSPSTGQKVRVFRPPCSPSFPVHRHRRHNSVWDNMYWHQWRLRRALLREVHASQFLVQSLPKKVFSLLHFPFLLARNLTIPLVEEEAWSRRYASLCAVFAPLFLLQASGNLTATVGQGAFPVPLIVLAVGVAGAIFIRQTTHVSRPPTAHPYVLALAVTGFVMCSAWIYAIAAELVAVVTALGTLLSLPPSLLGLTLLAWGNSAGDLIANMAVARAGLGDMAIAGCFAGPTFNLLMGLGCSFLWKVFRTGPFSLNFDDSAYISLSFLYLALGTNLVVGYCSGFRVGKGLAWPLIILYVTYTLLQVLLIGKGLRKGDA